MMIGIGFFIVFVTLHSITDAVCPGSAVAADILNNPNITLRTRHPSGEVDNAYPLNNIQAASIGQPASRSQYTCSECPNPGAPGGSVCLDTQVLDYLKRLGQSNHFTVSSIAGACHSCTSRHYRGLAVDITKLGVETYTSLRMAACTASGGWALSETYHVHCQFYLPGENRG